MNCVRIRGCAGVAGTIVRRRTTSTRRSGVSWTCRASRGRSRAYGCGVRSGSTVGAPGLTAYVFVFSDTACGARQTIAILAVPAIFTANITYPVNFTIKMVILSWCICRTVFAIYVLPTEVVLTLIFVADGTYAVSDGCAGAGRD